MWGVIALGLFADDRGTGLTGGTGYKFDDAQNGEPPKVIADRSGMGLFYGHSQLLADNLFLVLMIIVWVGGTMGATFFLLKLATLLRVSEEVERKGLDTSKHGVRASITLTVAEQKALSLAVQKTEDVSSTSVSSTSIQVAPAEPVEVLD